MGVAASESDFARIAEAANALAADDAPPTSLAEATPVVGRDESPGDPA